MAAVVCAEHEAAQFSCLISDGKTASSKFLSFKFLV